MFQPVFRSCLNFLRILIPLFHHLQLACSSLRFTPPFHELCSFLWDRVELFLVFVLLDKVRSGSLVDLRYAARLIVVVLYVNSTWVRPRPPFALGRYNLYTSALAGVVYFTPEQATLWSSSIIAGRTYQYLEQNNLPTSRAKRMPKFQNEGN